MTFVKREGEKIVNYFAVIFQGPPESPQRGQNAKLLIAGKLANIRIVIFRSGEINAKKLVEMVLTLPRKYGMIPSV